jgi:hypothetical protein
MPYTAIRHQIADCLHVLVHLERRHGRRVVTQLRRLCQYDPATDRYQLESLSHEIGPPQEELKLPPSNLTGAHDSHA